MAKIRAIALYPHPKDPKAFEKAYFEEHMPMAFQNLKGTTKIFLAKFQGRPGEPPPFYRIAELHFPSQEALDACMGTEGAMRTAQHAVQLSTGGPTIFLFAEEIEEYEFDSAGRPVKL